MKGFVLGVGIGTVTGIVSVLAAIVVFIQGPASATGTIATPTLLFENARVKVWSLTLEPGQSTAKHTHEFDEIVVCLEGSRIRSIKPGPEPEGETFQPSAGEVFMLSVKGVTHVLTNTGTTRYKQISIELKETVGT
jgi:quercetin dioxygenase-like cupin family protein